MQSTDKFFTTKSSPAETVYASTNARNIVSLRKKCKATPMFSKPSSCSQKYKPECCIFLLAGNSPFSQRKPMSSRSTRVRRRNGFQRVLKQSTFLIITTARETRIVSSVWRAQRLKTLSLFLHLSFYLRLLKLPK